MNLSKLARDLEPFLLPRLRTVQSSITPGTGGLAAHALNGPYHTGTLAESQAPWAVTNAAFSAHTSNPNAHHSRQHDILSSSDHTVAGGAQLDVVGLSAPGTLTLLTPSSNPGAVSALLKSSSAGNLTLPTMTATMKVTTSLVDTASGDLTLAPAGNVQIGAGPNLGSLHVARSAGSRIILGDSGAGYSAVVGNRQHAPGGASLDYAAYWAYDAFFDDTTDQWLAVRSTLGGKWKMEASYHAGSLKISYSATADPISWTDYVTVAASSNVGIGTTTPSYKLDVNGTARVSTSLTTPLITTNTDTDLVINPAGTGAVQFPDDQKLRTTTFDSGLPLIRGWQINEVEGVPGQSAFTISKIQADELRVRLFVADEVRVDRGDELWTKSYGIIRYDFTTPSAIGGTVRVYFEDSPALAGAIFTPNDWLLIRQLDIDTGIDLFNVWGQVSGYIDEGNGVQSWLFTLRQGPANKDIKTGALGIDFGESGAAWIHLSTIDVAGAPYIKMRKWAGANPYTPANYTTYVQIGHLGSIGNSLYTPVGYGLYIRSTAAAGQFLVADDNGLQIRNARIALWNGASNDILIDTDGIRVRAAATEPLDDINSYRFETSGGAVMGGLYARHFSNTYDILLQAVSDATNDGYLTIRSLGHASNNNANVFIYAGNAAGTKEASIWLDVDNTTANLRFQADDKIRFESATQSFENHEPFLDLGANLGSGLKRWGTVFAGVLTVTTSITVGGTAVSLTGHTHDDRYFTETESDARFLQLSGGILVGTLTSRTVAPSANNTYNLGTSDNYYNNAYIRNLYTDIIVGTPSYSHTHAATDITSGTLSDARLPSTQTGKTFTSAVVIDADSTGTSNYIRWLTQVSTGKAWDLIGRAHDYVTGGQQNDLLLTYYDGSTIYTVWQADSGTRIVDFAQTPTVAGAAVSLSGHIHDDRYYTESEVNSLLTGYVPTSRTVSAGAAMTGGGALSANITISHADTSSQASVDNSGVNFIQDITLDTYGHVTAIGTASIASALDATYVNVTGDTMTGPLGLPVAWTSDIHAISRGYALSRGMNLVTNGSGLLGSNYNFSGGSTFDPIETHGGGGSFRYTGSTAGRTSDEYIPVDPEKFYRMVLWAKAGNADGSGYDAANRQYAGVVCCDADKLQISPVYFTRYGSSALTTLATQLNPGDTTVTLTDATGWGASAVNAYQRQFLWWPYTNSFGYVYPNYTYSRNGTRNTASYLTNGAWAVGGISGNTITLTAPWPGPTLPAGTKVMNSSSGSNYKYILLSNVSVPQAWTRYEGYIGEIDTQLLNPDTKFAPGTAYVRLLFLVNYAGSSSNVIRYSDIWFSEVSSRNLEAASATVPGIVTLVNQQLGAGTKWVPGRFGVNMSSAPTLYDLDVNGTGRFSGAVYANSGAVVTGSASASVSVIAPLFTAASGNVTVSAPSTLLLNAAAANTVDLQINGVSQWSVNAERINPRGTILVDIGDYNRKVRTLHAAELNVEVLVAQRVMATIGGRILVAPTTKLIADCASGSTTIDVEHNSLSSGTYLYLSSAPGGVAQVEAMRLTSGPTTIPGGYRYSITRNLDGSGANQWYAGDAVVSLGAVAGEGYIDLTSTSTIHNHYGPTTTYYVRTGTATWSDVAPVVSQGNLRSFVDYVSDEFGTAGGNNLTLTPASGFAGYTIDRSSGLRLFNTDLRLYSGATEAVRLNNSVGLRLTTGASAINTVSWHNATEGYEQATIVGNLVSGTSTLSLQARARDIVSGAFSGAAQVILSNATTSSSIKLLANDGSVDGPNKYLLIGGGAAVISGMYLGVGTTSPFEAFEVRSDGGKGFSVNPDYGGVTWIYAHDRITDTPIPLVIRAANTIMNASNVQVVGTGGVTIGIDATSGGYTALQLQLSAAMGGYSILQSIAASGSSYGTLALNPSGGAVAVNSSTASYALDVNGAAHASSFPTSSDARFKEALAPLSNVLARLEHINAYNFYWRRNYAAYEQFVDERDRPQLQIGFLAQEVEQEFPELISRWRHVGRDGIVTADAYSVDYARMVPVLVQAIRELRAELAALRILLN